MYRSCGLGRLLGAAGKWLGEREDRGRPKKTVRHVCVRCCSLPPWHFLVSAIFWWWCLFAHQKLAVERAGLAALRGRGPPWDWQWIWDSGVVGPKDSTGPFQLFSASPVSYLFKFDASKLAHIANDAGRTPAQERRFRARRTPCWVCHGIVIAIGQSIRPVQHHGHLSAILCSTAGGDYVCDIKVENKAHMHITAELSIASFKFILR
ncbi:uncharacterized protein PgNI_08754 [Pyricularia grisea]|uniref:Uncharacterized protein n=1 Tax=Pyricularia grisea TaxID=148305 RepID=A0A6P8AVT5_PYRGI|nr:uncharacterized protein PgNI_08754 [Pyricularia grisea]TLD06307.1 hypothetical protein PgNI_08754 [Pyricularia grisea]